MLITTIKVENDVAKLYDKKDELIYEVYKDGRIVNVKENKDLEQSPDGTHQGYLRISNNITIDNKNLRRVHAIVYRCFNGPVDDNAEIHHKWSNETNNHIDNLILAKDTKEHTKFHRLEARENLLSDKEVLTDDDLQDFIEKYASFGKNKNLLLSNNKEITLENLENAKKVLFKYERPNDENEIYTLDDRFIDITILG